MAKYDHGGGCSCGLYRDCICGAEGISSPFYREPPTPKTYNNCQINIPNIGSEKPSNYQMVLKVSEAIEVNNDFEKILKENARMKAALSNIFNSTTDPIAMRYVAIGLGWGNTIQEK